MWKDHLCFVSFIFKESYIVWDITVKKQGPSPERQTCPDKTSTWSIGRHLIVSGSYLGHTGSHSHSCRVISDRWREKRVWSRWEREREKRRIAAYVCGWDTANVMLCCGIWCLPSRLLMMMNAWHHVSTTKSKKNQIVSLMPLSHCHSLSDFSSTLGWISV